MKKFILALMACLFWQAYGYADPMLESARVLGLNDIEDVEISHFYADGGSMGGQIVDRDGSSVIFSYDGRQTFLALIPGHKYHVFVGAFDPGDENAKEIKVCSDREIAIFKIVSYWVAERYPQNWESGAFAGYIKRYLADMKSRSCNE